MEQRRPRLGDILDDYCPRERRLSNHVVVAMIGEDVKQTRCTTCDAEHPYKNARIPPRRKVKEPPAALVQPAPEGTGERPRLNGDAPHLVAAVEAAPAPAPEPETPAERAAPAEPGDAPDDGPVHRPLIRATLPRPEGEVKERPIPEFTMRAARNSRNFRAGNARFGNKSGGRGARQAAGNFRPGVMDSWSPSNQRQRGGASAPGRHQQPRSPGNKKSR